jgi:hypothetical protein
MQHQKELQDAAADCIIAFVEYFQIQHEDISKLTAHLQAMPTDHGWPECEEVGTLLRLPGRGG